MWRIFYVLEPLSLGKRYLVPSQGPDVEALKRCIAFAVKQSQKNEYKTITLLVPVKKGFEHSNVADLLGQKVMKALLNGNRVKAIDDIYFELESIKTFRENASYEIIIGLYLTQRELDIFDAVRNVKELIFLPWLEEESNNWIDRWNPKILGEEKGGEEKAVQSSLLSSVVEKELSDLTSVINHSTGLGHPLDKQKAEDIFKTLRTRGETINPNDIKNWAIRNGWAPKHADQLAKLASKYSK
jgi:hypothetical protein